MINTKLANEPAGLNGNFFIRKVGRRVIIDAGDIGAIHGKNSTLDNLRRQRRTPGPRRNAVSIHGTEPGFEVEHFAGRIGVINLPLKFYFFITAPPTAKAFFFPRFRFTL
ncbi:MAG: hypothetical protein A2X84_03865 [Desulfuromonadaceae bacterium GWC2_58_13]|nr:MAG: hypothetical protein A2X84_03865 [Desulfuromonadaceae bacterium GWC2_58_13]